MLCSGGEKTGDNEFLKFTDGGALLTLDVG
jgi:hypothetical protein